MSAASPKGAPSPVFVWLGQLAGTVVIAAVIVYFFKSGVPFAGKDPDFARYALIGGLLSCAAPLGYLGTFKARLDDDQAQARARGGDPDPARRQALLKSLAIGGALAEIPQGFGLLHLVFGGEIRWFLVATMVTVALRLSYRPFTR